MEKEGHILTFTALAEGKASEHIFQTAALEQVVKEKFAKIIAQDS